MPNGIDTLELDFERTIQFISEDQHFVLHYLIAYENDIGNLYDTYFRTSYEFKLVLPTLFMMKDKQIYMRRRLQYKVALKDMFVIQNSKPSYYAYNKDETKKIGDLLKEMEALPDSVLQNILSP